MDNMLKSLSVVGALAPVILAVMGLLGYIPNLEFLGRVKEGYIPMAPSTAVSFLILGFIQLFVCTKPLSKKNRIISSGFILLVSLFGLLEVAGHFSGMDLNFENMIVPDAGYLNSVPIARMSPATGGGFFLSGIVLLLRFAHGNISKYKSVFEYFESGLALLVLLISFIFCLAYFYGTPLLYGMGTTVPMALTTALGFFFLSHSILFSEKERLPIRLFVDRSTRGYLLRFIFPLSTLSVIATSVSVLLLDKISKINPAFIAAALTVLVASISGIIAAVISRHMGQKIDLSELVLKEVNKKLRKSEENLRTTLNSIGDAVIATDRNGKITQMNPVAEKLTGWSLNEAKRKQLNRIFQIIHAQTRDLIENPVETVLSTGKVVERSRQTVLIARDGTEYHISKSGAPILSDIDEIDGIVLVFRDISEERAMQEQLNHHNKMDAIGQLAGGIAHDFNNMLTGIIGAAQLLQSPKRNIGERNRRHVDVIMQAAIRAADLTSKLLSFSRKRKPKGSFVNVHRMIDDTISILNRTIDKRIKIHAGKNAEHNFVYGDESDLQTALINIGINASHAMQQDGGYIQIGTKNIELNRAYCDSSPFNISPGEYIEIKVEDTGCGIPAENMRKIFEPFYTTKEEGKGTGLGLATVYGAVKDHYGEVSVSSGLGVGTAFYILLPCSEEKAAPGKG